MAEKFARYDAADYLDSPGIVTAYLEEALTSGEPSLIARALGAVARAQNLSKLARDTGLTRPGLRKALSGDGNPSFDTIMKVSKALGVQMRFTIDDVASSKAVGNVKARPKRSARSAATAQLKRA